MTPILPQPDAPHRLADQITTSLSKLPGVQRIAVFGSLATNTADAYSDVDMFVVCDDVPSCSWAAVHALRLAKPVLFYRMFSTDHQPAGRYWFDDSSPLTRLDISFHTAPDYQQLLATGQYLGYPLQTRTLHVASANPIAAVSVPPAPLVITHDETFFGERIYRIVRAVKNALRHQPFRYSAADCITWLNEAIARTQHHRFAGGDGHALARACLQLARTIPHGNTRMKPSNRCPWPQSALDIAYHDHEWGVPCHDDTKLFEMIVLDAAQAGLSWSTILNKRENYRRAFARFDPRKVARFTPAKIEKLLLDPGIVRNRLKVNSAVTNARAFLAVQKEFTTFDQYIWSFVNGKPVVNHWTQPKQVPATSPESDALSKDLKKRGFNFVGSTIIYAMMQAGGLVNDHLVTCPRHAACAKLR
ncbi:MAG: DNA-3-methyladenine glycosylase I [Phycisphaerales bacterium]